MTVGFHFGPAWTLYSPDNQKALDASIAQLNAGKIVSKTLKELQGMPNEC